MIGLPALRARLYRHRRALAAVCAALAVWSGLSALAPGSAPGAAVVVAATALPGGAPLGAEVLEVREFPPELVPEDAVANPAELAGRTLMAPAARGTPIGAGDVVASRLPQAGAKGTVVAPVTPSDPSLIGVLAVGDRVDVVATGERDEATAGVVVSQAPVVAIPTSSNSGPLSGTDSGPGSTVLLRVRSDQVGALTAAAARGALTLVLHQR